MTDEGAKRIAAALEQVAHEIDGLGWAIVIGAIIIAASVPRCSMDARHPIHIQHVAPEPSR